MVKLESCFYQGFVYHTRHKTPGDELSIFNSFKYPVIYLYLDLSELDVVFSHIPFASINSCNIISWFREDYIGNDSNTDLSEYIKDLVWKHCNRRPDTNGKVRLLTVPTQFGYGFNPISFFYCFNEQNTRLQAIVCQVQNTPWLETHCYVLPFFEQTEYCSIFRKCLHVSPFYDCKLHYVWSFAIPNCNGLKIDGCIWRHIGSKQKCSMPNDIIQHEWGTSSLATAMDINLYCQPFVNESTSDEYFRVFQFGFADMKRMDITLLNMILCLLYFPVMSCVMQWWIHWQAVKIWFKGMKIVDHPNGNIVPFFPFFIKHGCIFIMSGVMKCISMILIFCLSIINYIYSALCMFKTYNFQS